MLEPELTPEEHARLVAEADAALARFTESDNQRTAASGRFAALKRRLDAEKALRLRNAERRAMWQALHSGGAQ